MARIKKNLRRITIEKEACKKLSSCQGSSKSKIQTKSTFLPEQMRMADFPAESEIFQKIQPEKMQSSLAYNNQSHFECSFDDEEIPNSENLSNDESEFVEKIVDDIVFVVAEEIVGENFKVPKVSILFCRIHKFK